MEQLNLEISNTVYTLIIWAATFLTSWGVYLIFKPIISVIIRPSKYFSGLQVDAIRIAIRLALAYFTLRIFMSTFELEISGTVALIGLAAAGAIGMSAESLISNVFSGIVFRNKRLFNVGDYVMLANMRGVVVYMDSQSVLLESLDYDRIIIPWTQIVNSIIINESNSYRAYLRPIEISIPINEGDAREIVVEFTNRIIDVQQKLYNNWNDHQKKVFNEAHDTIGYPYVVLRGWEEDNRLFYGYILASYQDDRKIDRIASEIRMDMDKFING